MCETHWTAPADLSAWPTPLCSRGRPIYSWVLRGASNKDPYLGMRRVVESGNIGASGRAIASNHWYKCCVKRVEVKRRLSASLEYTRLARSTYDGTDSFFCNSYTLL
jgi:hypothetical protein